MDEIKRALIDEIVKLIHAIGAQAGAAVAVALTAIGGAVVTWFRSHFSAPKQRQAFLDAAVATEKWAIDEAAKTGEKPPNEVLHARARELGRAALPLLHKPWMPGTADRKIKEVVPEAKRLSMPPPAPQA